MTENEQIEEMARDICEYFYEGRCYLDKKECDCKCSELKDAQYLYSKGYRKVERGEWEQYGLRNPKCTLCHGYNTEKSNFCPNCGANMRGATDER